MRHTLSFGTLDLQRTRGIRSRPLLRRMYELHTVLYTEYAVFACVLLRPLYAFFSSEVTQVGGNVWSTVGNYSTPYLYSTVQRSEGHQMQDLDAF